MPALLALAVSRVPPTERGTVVGTATVFLDLRLRVRAGRSSGSWPRRPSYGATFLVSAALAVVAAVLLLARRESLERPAARVATG